MENTFNYWKQYSEEGVQSEGSDKFDILIQAKTAAERQEAAAKTSHCPTFLIFFFATKTIKATSANNTEENYQEGIETTG
jgi:hypothetical protein